MAVIAKVAVQAATYAIDKAYDYLLPEEVGGQAGCRVLVPFGRGNRLTEAMILSLHQAVPDKPLKAVRSLLDEEPVITERELRLALWMTRRYVGLSSCCGRGSGIRRRSRPTTRWGYRSSGLRLRRW